MQRKEATQGKTVGPEKTEKTKTNFQSYSTCGNTARAAGIAACNERNITASSTITTTRALAGSIRALRIVDIITGGRSSTAQGTNTHLVSAVWKTAVLPAT
jgi:hypothetical protein